MKQTLSEKKIIILAIALIAIIASIITFLVIRKKKVSVNSSNETCTAIKVTINNQEENKLALVELQQIEDLVKSYKVLNQPMKEVITGTIEEKLKSKGLFKIIEAYKINTTLCVDVSLKTPFFLVQPNKGKAYYVTRERKQLTEQDTTFFDTEREMEVRKQEENEENIIPFNLNYRAIQVPIVTGELTKDYATTQIYDLLTILESDAHFKDYFGHIYMDSKRGLILRPKFCNTDIIFGYATNWEEMLHKLYLFEEEVIKRQSWETFKYLKFNYHNQIIAQKIK